MSLRARRGPLAKLSWASAIGLVAGIASWLLADLPVFRRWEGGAYDLRVQQLARPLPGAEKIRLVYLDQGSLDWGADENQWRWPWNRELYGAMLSYFTRGGAASVTFDVIFSEDSVWGVADDQALGGAMKTHGRVVSAMLVSETPRKSLVASWPAGLPAPPPPPAGTPAGWPGARAASFPIPVIATNAFRLGTVNARPDPDGVFRSVPVFTRFDGHLLPSLGLATHLASAPRALPPIPVRPDGSALLRFLPSESFPPPLSAGAVLKSFIQLEEGATPQIPPETFKDCHVFFGFSAEGLKDLRPTPLSPSEPGVTLHATLLANLRDGRFIREASAPAWTALAALLAAGCAAWALFNTSWKGHLPALLAALLTPWAAGFAAYALDVWWPVVPTLAATLSACAAGILVNYATEGRQKAFIQQAFSRYVSPAYIERIVRNPEELQLGGVKRTLSIFFSDLAGFSSFSERLDPARLTALLNDYLTEMTDIIQSEGGTLDKYIGDAIVAFWNAPVEQPDHAARAVRAAVRCQQRLEEIRPRYRETAGVDLRMRVGVNTGEVVVGNFGSRRQFNYTMLGDAANLASRLEGANKAFGTYLMVSESTWRLLDGAIPGRLLARLRVVGRAQAVAVYEPFAGAPPPAAVVARYAEGQERLTRGDLAGALACFEDNPGDAPSERHARAVKKWIADPSSFEQGVWNLTDK